MGVWRCCSSVGDVEPRSESPFSSSSSSNAVDIGFLQPWTAALRSCLTPSGLRSPSAIVRGSFQSWPTSPEPLYNIKCSFVLTFPADENARRERSRLHLIREALELFTLLAVVDNVAFVVLLSDFMKRIDVDRVFSGRMQVIHPIWKCTLSKALSPEDAAARQAVMTWGDLFGCPDDPWMYSQEFRSAMLKLQTMARGETRDWSGNYATIEWVNNHHTSPMTGSQQGVRDNSVAPTLFGLSCQLGKLLDTEVPPVVQLCSVRGGDTVLQMWKVLPRDTRSELVFRRPSEMSRG